MKSNNRQRTGTPLPMERYNNKLRERKLREVIKDNFGDNDYFIILHYNRDFSIDETKAKKYVYKYIKILKELYRLNGAELKYVKATRKGKRNGITHYMILGNGAEPKKIAYLWEYTFEPPRIKELKEIGEKMLLKPFISSDSVSFRLNERGYTTSRNLKRRKED